MSTRGGWNIPLHKPTAPLSADRMQAGLFKFMQPDTFTMAHVLSKEAARDVLEKSSLIVPIRIAVQLHVLFELSEP